MVALATLGLSSGCDPKPASTSTGDPAPSTAGFHIYVTNESSGDLSIIDGETNQVIETVQLGKRPRGIRVSPDRRHLFIALSGSPLAPPGVDESTLPPPDKAADGIGVFDLTQRKLVRILRGSLRPRTDGRSSGGQDLRRQ